MAATIIDGSQHHFVSIWEGNGGGQKVGNFVPFTDNGTVANSVIFNYDETHILDKTFGSAGTSRKKYTFSVWCKLGRKLGSEERRIIMVGPAGNDDGFRFDDDNTVHIWFNGTIDCRLYTNRTFEDTSKWYHFVLAVDTTQATAANRVKFYVDGDQITSFSTEVYPSQDYTGHVGNNQEHTWGAAGGNQEPYDGYMAEVNYVDGTAYGPDTFGVTDTTTGRWVPKSLSGISYGSHGYRLKFQDSSALGDDTSGNGNDFSASNFASGDYTTDSPTQNFATMSPPFSGSIGFDEGNLKISATASNDWETAYVGKNVNSGKWYFEYTATTTPTYHLIGLTTLSGYVNAKNTYVGDNAGSYGYQFAPGGNHYIYYDGSNTDLGSGSSLSNGNIVGVAYDADTGAFWVAVNNTWILSGNPSTGANPVLVANAAKQDIYFGISTYNGGVFDFNFGQKSLSYTPPTDFKLLQQDNFPETTKGIPDFMQIKNRDAADRWCWQDSLRGFGEYGSSASGAPGSPVQFNSAITDGVTKTLKGGFAIEDSDYVNSAAESYVSFNWVANNAVSATDSSGNMDCELQANPTAGFSIAKFTVNGTGLRTWAHGLGKTPEFGHLWVYNSTTYGTFYHHKMSATPAQNYMFMSTSGGLASFTNGWGESGPSSSLWSGTEGQLFSNGVPYMFYSWTGIDGYSKFDTYVGNGSTDGTFVYTGFKPRTIWIKSTAAVSNYVFDTVRYPNNIVAENVVYDGNYSEASTGNEGLIVMSNGFKLATTSTGTNNSGVKYIYGAWAEHPTFGEDGFSIATAYG